MKANAKLYYWCTGQNGKVYFFATDMNADFQCGNRQKCHCFQNMYEWQNMYELTISSHNEKCVFFFIDIVANNTAAFFQIESKYFHNFTYILMW